MQILQDLEQNNPNLLQFGYYYGKSILHFLDSNVPVSVNTSSANNANINKDLNIALFYSLV